MPTKFVVQPIPEETRLKLGILPNAYAHVDIHSLDEDGHHDSSEDIDQLYMAINHYKGERVLSVLYARNCMIVYCMEFTITPDYRLKTGKQNLDLHRIFPFFDEADINYIENTVFKIVFCIEDTDWTLLPVNPD